MSSGPSFQPLPGRHRDERERRLLRAGVMVAPVMTAGAVALGMSTAEAAPSTATAHEAGPVEQSSANLVDAARTKTLDRALDRTTTASTATAPTAVTPVQPDLDVLLAKPKVRYATDALNIRETPTDDAAVVTEIASGTLVKATGAVDGAYTQVLWKGETRWVTGEYLSADRPATPETMGLSDTPCRDGGVENGLTSDAVRVYRAVCNNFPDITSYGGYDAHGEHSSGKAIDIMHPSVEEGYRIAEFLKAHASELHLYDVIWRQHIWTPVRASEGWRGMPNRGSATANHFDHVHVSVN